MDHEAKSPAKPSLLPKHLVLSRAGICSSRLYELIAEGQFPPPVKIGRSSRWVSTEVDAWVAEQIARRDFTGVPITVTRHDARSPAAGFLQQGRR